MLTGLKVSSLAFKCAFYRTEQNAKGGQPRSLIFKFLKCKNEIYQLIELKK